MIIRTIEIKKKTKTAQDRKKQMNDKPPPSTSHKDHEKNDQDKATHLTDDFLIKKPAETERAT